MEKLFTPNLGEDPDEVVSKFAGITPPTEIELPFGHDMLDAQSPPWGDPDKDSPKKSYTSTNIKGRVDSIVDDRT